MKDVEILRDVGPDRLLRLAAISYGMAGNYDRARKLLNILDEVGRGRPSTWRDRYPHLAFEVDCLLRERPGRSASEACNILRTQKWWDDMGVNGEPPTLEVMCKHWKAAKKKVKLVR
jgi:hypothetical protein